MPSVECPKCSGRQFVAWDGIGERSICPFCNAEFPAVATDDTQAIDESQSIARFVTGTYEPTDSQERAWLIGEAKWLVKKPGNGLIVIGLIGMFLMTVIGLGRIFYGIRQNFGSDADIFYGILMLTTGNLYCLLIAAGGRSLKRLEHRGLGFASATLAMLSALPCGGWLIVSIPAVIIATWTFAVLHNPAVKHAMRWIRQDRDESHELR